MAATPQPAKILDVYGNFGIHVDFLRASKGTVFLRKTPLGCVLSVYTNSEIAIGDRAKAKRTIREVHQRGMAGFATLQLLRVAEKDRLHHSFNLRGHLLSGDAVGGLKPATRGSEDGPSGRGRQQC